VSGIASVPAPFANALFLMSAMILAGIAHVLWLRTPWSKRLRMPIDCGLKWRGHRLFGDNKMVRGFIALPPAAALSFALLGGMRPWLPEWLAAGIWNLSPMEYALLGFGCGLAFMLAELPNSFVKRQLGVQPGEAPSSKFWRPVFLLVDRLDSVLGVLLLVTAVLPVSAMTWFWVLLLGPATHTAFSVWLYWSGEKRRAL
jgi:hypothetical protein